MKYFLPTTVLAGVISLAACNERPKQESVSLDEILSETSSSPSTTATHKPDRKVWPPVSNEYAAIQTTENYLVVLDDSGSMDGDKMKQAKQALITLADTLPAEHNLGLIHLNSPTKVPLGTKNRAAFKQAVHGSSARGGTPLRASTTRAFQEITTQASRQQGYGSYHMIIVTDGESSDKSPMDIVRQVVAKTSVQVHVIGFHVASHEMNDPRYVDYRTASNAAELAKAFKEVAAETNEFSDPKEFTQ